MRRRSQVVAGLLAATLVAGGGVTYVVTQGDKDAGTTVASSPEPSPRTPPMSPLATTGGPTPAGVQAALAGLAADPAFGGSLSALVVDGTDGDVLYSRRADSSVPPASTVKLLTAAAALDALGPDARLTTSVVRSGRTLYLVGGGDMTLASTPAKRDDYPVRPTIGGLAKAVAAALADRPASTYKLRYDDTVWSGPSSAPGWNDGYYYGGDVSHLSALEVDEGRVDPDEQVRVADPPAQAATQFLAALRDVGVKVADNPVAAPAPAAAENVAEVSSAPMSALVQRMLTVSDNDLAESLGRAVAVADGGAATFKGAAAAVTRRAEALGATDIELSDASGLSRLDRVSPAALVAVLQASLEHPDLRPLLAGLPVAGLTGTIADRFRHGRPRAGAGVVRAKTGTLTGVSALAGHVVDAGGRVLVFAFLTDHAPSTDAAEDALDRLAGRLADCGCGGAA